MHGRRPRISAEAVGDYARTHSDYPFVMPLAEISGASHLALDVADLRCSIEFYTKVLGMRVLVDASDDPVQPAAKGMVGDFLIELAQLPSGADAAKIATARLELPGPCFSLTVRGASEAFRRLRAQGLVTADEPADSHGVVYFSFRDPDNHAVELIEMPDGAASLGHMIAAHAAAAEREGKMSKHDPYRALEELGLELPPLSPPVANFIPSQREGQLLYLSGQGPRDGQGTLMQGKVGTDFSAEEAYEHAKYTGLALLSVIHHELGSLSRVRRVVKLFGMVNATPDFARHPQVINGCSDLFCQVLGSEVGQHARSAVGMGSLPGNISVEIEAVVSIAD